MNSRKAIWFLSLGAAAVVAIAVSAHLGFKQFPARIEQAENESSSDGDAVNVPASVPASTKEILSQPANSSALGDYNVLIADRGNNRLIEVSPDKKMLWQYKFNLPRPGLGADDSFFTDGGQQIIVNLEEYHMIQLIDFKTKKVTWQYGVPGVPGSAAGQLNTPDDAYKLPNGDITVADIKNCRIIEISPDKKIVRQYGVTKKCGTSDGLLNKPNGDTPLSNGHTYVSNIRNDNLVELDQNWKPVFSVVFPGIAYPSDPQPTRAGNILISDYSKDGKIEEIDHSGNIVWEFEGDQGVRLNHPSLAVELPNGNILANDDLNHRVIVVDKQTKKIVWQYGVTAKPGVGPGQLNIPDGLDIIPVGAQDFSAVVQPTPLGVGQVSRHAKNFLGSQVEISGFVLQNYGGYVIFSDEPNGSIGYYDLPVAGPGLSGLKQGQKYLLTGTLLASSVHPVNKYPYHLQLANDPQPQ